LGDAVKRNAVLLRLEEKFAPLLPAVRARVEALSSEELDRLAVDLLKARSLKELDLEE
jgi:hypothetical protein